MNREKLVNKIIELTGDEVDQALLLSLAKMTEPELVDNIINIAVYYKTAYNNN